MTTVELGKISKFGSFYPPVSLYLAWIPERTIKGLNLNPTIEVFQRRYRKLQHFNIQRNLQKVCYVPYICLLIKGHSVWLNLS